jgi:HTH-type transcriptional regulator/antitoxin MqsA
MNRESDTDLCPVCGEGSLTEHQDVCEVEYRGHSEELPSVYSLCDVCGVEQTTAEQERRNKRETIAFRKRVDGLLTGQELRALRERLGVSQKQAAALFGGGPVAFSKYENDEVAQSEAMDRLLRLASEVPEALTWLSEDAGEPVQAVSAQREHTLTFSQKAIDRPNRLKGFQVEMHSVVSHLRSPELASEPAANHQDMLERIG